MSRSALSIVAVAGLYGALGVAAAAAAAHLDGDARLATASQFLLFHASALVAAAAASRAFQLGAWLLAPGWCLALGALLFCGDLSVRVAYGASPLPLAAPIGGTLLILGWLGVAVGAALGGLRSRPRP